MMSLATRIFFCACMLLLPAMQAGAAIPESAVKAAAGVPIQDGGRIKPLDTYARFTLLSFSGRTVLRTEEGEALSALDWLLECLLDAATAKGRPVFLIENPEVMESLSLAHDKPRDRFSYEVLAPSRSIALSLARQYAGLPDEHRTPAQKQMLQLAHNLQLFESLTNALSPFAKDPTNPALPRLGELLANAKDGRIDLAGSQAAQRFFTMDHANVLAVIPPDTNSEKPETWLNPAMLLDQMLAGNPLAPNQVAAVVALEQVCDAGMDAEALTNGFLALRAASAAMAPTHRELSQVPRELFFYRMQPFYWSLLLYILAFLLVALSWIFPGQRILYLISIFALAAPCALQIFGITLRCIIRGRPPVSTLYETILFVTAVVVVVALLVEVMNRKRIAVGIGATLGAIGLFLANKYEAIDRTDTMPNLIAVLDTNFWLATHVTTVTMGYAAGLLAGGIAHVYVFGKAFGYRKQDPAFYKNITRMVYGVFCFGLLFATVGTVLGGIWANESWGRFWGWDPKENGALMIVLWGLAVLHARMGGYVRDYGLNMAAIFGGIIVSFSWFGVNLLGVGLHSYGFTSGVQTALTQFYIIESIVLAIAAFGWLREQDIVRIRLPEKR